MSDEQNQETGDSFLLQSEAGHAQHSDVVDVEHLVRRVLAT